MSKRNHLGKAMGDTSYMLEQWGWWRLSGMGVPRYVSPALALMRDNMPDPGSVCFCITDELAMTVDGCVARLSKRDPQMGDCLWLYFGAKWPAIRVGRHFKIGEAKARELINAGVAWVDSAIEHMREAA